MLTSSSCNLTIIDLPSILSGERLGIIDPHQKFFAQSTYGCNMRKHPGIVDTLEHQFQPYLGLFGITRDMLRRGQFRHTLFRYEITGNNGPFRSSNSFISHFYRRIHSLREGNVFSRICLFTRGISCDLSPNLLKPVHPTTTFPLPRLVQTWSLCPRYLLGNGRLAFVVSNFCKILQI